MCKNLASLGCQVLHRGGVQFAYLHTFEAFAESLPMSALILLLPGGAPGYLE